MGAPLKKPWEDREVLERNREQWPFLDAAGVALRTRCLTDAVWFGQNVMGFNRLVRPLHSDMSEFCKREFVSRSDVHLVVAPRQCFKTTMANVVETTQLLLGQPDLRVAEASGTDDKAQTLSAQIMRVFERNHMVRALFPDVVWEQPRTEAPSWAKTGWTLKRKFDDRVPTMSTMSVQSGGTGFHFHLIVADDVVTTDNVRTSEQLEDVKRFFADCYSLRRRKSDILPTGGKIRVINTPYVPNDAIMELLEDESVPRFWKGIYGEPGKRRGLDSDIIFPEEFTHESIEELVRRKGRLADSQVFCTARSSENSSFKPDWIRWYEPGDHPSLDLMNVYIAVDPNRSPTPGSDPIAIVVAGLDAQERLWVMEHRTGHPTLNQTIEWCAELCARYHPLELFFESTSAQLQVANHMRERFVHDGVKTRVVPVPRPPTKKTLRIMALQMPLEDGLVWLPRNRSGQYIANEIQLYDGEAKNPRDDALDCMADIYKLGKRPKPTDVVRTEATNMSYVTAVRMHEMMLGSQALSSHVVGVGLNTRVRVR